MFAPKKGGRSRASLSSAAFLLCLGVRGESVGVVKIQNALLATAQMNHAIAKLAKQSLASARVFFRLESQVDRASQEVAPTSLRAREPGRIPTLGHLTKDRTRKQFTSPPHSTSQPRSSPPTTKSTRLSEIRELHTLPWGLKWRGSSLRCPPTLAENT